MLEGVLCGLERHEKTEIMNVRVMWVFAELAGIFNVFTLQIVTRVNKMVCGQNIHKDKRLSTRIYFLIVWSQYL